MPLTNHPTSWYPTPIPSYISLLEKVIHKGEGFVHVYSLKRNVAYNLQYLEFVDRCLLDLNLSSVLVTQNYKMFIIVGCGVVESLLTYLLIRRGWYKTTEWELDGIMPGQEKRMNGVSKRIDSYIYTKLPHYCYDEMTFDSMIKKAEAKKVLGSDHGLYSKLQTLRKLRNKVHLQAVEEPKDTDWNSFADKEVGLMANVIHSIFTGSLFRPSQQETTYFEYLTRYFRK